MFGFKEEVIAGILAVALLVLLAAGIYLRHTIDANADLRLANSRLNSDIETHRQAEARLQRETESKEAAYVAAANAKVAIAAQLDRTRTDFDEIKRRWPKLKAWADTPLPADVDWRVRWPAIDPATRIRTGAAADGADR